MELLFGASMVLFMKDKMSTKIEKLLLGFASGVMIASAVWSLLIPSIEMVTEQGKISWLPATIGFSFGILFLYLLDSEMWGHRFNFDISKFNNPKNHSNETKERLKKTAMMIFAVTLHNIPEGMAQIRL